MDTVAAFSVTGGRLNPLGWTPTAGKRPRGMNIDPEGRFMYVGNQGSNAITVLGIDPETGELSGPLHRAPCPTPVDFAF